MNVARSVVLTVAVVVLAAACSTGISEEEHAAAQDEAAAASQRADSLEGQLSTARGELETAQSDLAIAEESVSAAEEDLAATEDALEELRSLMGASTANGSVFFPVLAAGTVRCGVNQDFAGWSVIDSDGDASGFDADFCRAFAAAAVGDADAVEFVPVGGADRYFALQIGSVDVVVRNTTHTMSRDSVERVDFGPTTFYDGQAFVGRAADFAPGSGPADLGGKSICVIPGTPLEQNAREIATAAGAVVAIEPVEGVPEAVEKVVSGQCDVATGDVTFLLAVLHTMSEDGKLSDGELVVFPDVPLTRQPLAPMILQGDTFWRDVVEWVVYTTFLAEEKGITSENIDDVAWDLETQRLFGVEGESVVAFGLAPDAFYQVIKQVGNYGEIYDRHLTPIGYVREGSLNRLFSDGGLLYPPRI